MKYISPYYFGCPERILKLLTPLDDTSDPKGYARNWRGACWESIAKANAQPKLNHGDRVKVAYTLHGVPHTEAVVHKHGKRTLFATPSGTLFRLSHWREREMEVVGAA